VVVSGADNYALMMALSAGLALTPLLFGADEPGREILHPVAVTIFGDLLSATPLDTVLTSVIFGWRTPNQVAESRANQRTARLPTGRAWRKMGQKRAPARRRFISPVNRK
jgi:hypothetical protein